MAFRKVILGSVAAMGMATAALAQDEAGPVTSGQTLPGGANALSESHGDWQVNCRIVTVDEANQRRCAATQRQVNQQDQNVLAVEFTTTGKELSGVLVLPFGLAVTEPVTLTIDSGEAMDIAFSTCVPAGCIVPIEVSEDMRAALRSGNSLAIGTQSVDGNPVALNVSLTGFGSATNRIAELAGS